MEASAGFEPAPRMQRQINELSQYNMTIKHISGDLNVMSDFLSRYPHVNKLTHRSTQTETPYPGTPSSVNKVQLNYSNFTDCVNWDKELDSTDYVNEVQLGHANYETIDSVPNCKHTPSNTLFPRSIMINSSESAIVHDSANTVNLIHSKLYQDTASHSLLNCCNDGINTITPQLDKDKTSLSHKLPEESHNLKFSNKLDQSESEIFDLNDVRIATAQDPILSNVIEWITAGSKPASIQNFHPPAELVTLWKSYNLLEYDNGVLYRIWKSTKDDTQKQLIVVPDSLQEKCLKFFHCSFLSLHAGIQTCYQNCLKKFWWPKMKYHFELFVTSCVMCNSNKPPRQYLRAPLQPLIFTEFGQCLAIDHIVPDVSSTNNTYKYILSMVDCFSNYIILCPVRTTQSEETIRHIIQKYVLIHGIPDIILHDRHQSFCSHLFAAILKAFNITDKKTTSFKSSTNGRCERQNKRVNEALRAVVPESNPNSWPKYLPYVNMTLNTLKNKHTGFSPNFLLYGREIKLPLDFFVENALRTTVAPKEFNAFKLYDAMRRTCIKVRNNAQTQAKHMKKAYDKNINLHSFKPGDYCFILVTGTRHKFARSWVGPKLIVEKLNDHLYRILLDDDPKTYKIVNIQKMKPYANNMFSPVNENPLINRPITCSANPYDPHHKSDSASDCINHEDDTFITLPINQQPDIHFNAIDPPHHSRPTRNTAPIDRFSYPPNHIRQR